MKIKKNFKFASVVLLTAVAAYWYFFAMSQPQTVTVLHQIGLVKIDAMPLAAGNGSLKAEGLTVVTGSDGIVTLQLEDESRIQILPDSRMTIKEARSDRRRLRSEVELQLDAGEIIKRVPTGDGRKRGSSLYTKEVNIGVRGTIFAAIADEQSTRLMVTEGEVEATTDGASSVPVPDNYGTVIEQGKSPIDPVELPVPPQQTSPTKSARVEQGTVEFDWLPRGPSERWAVEVARDSDFDYLISRIESDHSPVVVANLGRDGDYFWRVASIDAHGLRGRWSGSQVFKYKYHFAEGRKALDSLDSETALRHFRLAEPGYEDEIALLTADAQVYLDSGEYQASKERLEVLEKLAPEDIGIKTGLARIDIKQGKYDQAWNRLEPVLGTGVKKPYTTETAAMAAVGRGDYDTAHALAKRTLEVQPDNAMAQIIIDSIESGRYGQ